ncbi:MAG: phosphotransferase family protein [Lachnospirales bacterium]
MSQVDKVIAVRTSKIIYRDNDKVIKVFNEDYSKTDVLNEALNQARVEETGLNIPAILEVTKFEGKWAIISEFIEGKTLQRIMDDEPEKKSEYLEKFLDIQIDMHRKSAPLLNKLRDKMSRKIIESEYDATQRYDLQTRLESLPKHIKLCHGDFNPSNIIIKDDGTPYILDWAHATQGNASADVARTYLLFWLNGDIDGAKEYLNLFCKKTDTAIQYVQKWLPIVAASQSVTGREEEREFLRSWVDVVEYE